MLTFAHAAAPAGTVLRPRPRLSGARLRTTSGHRADDRAGQLVRGARLGKRAQRHAKLGVALQAKQ